MMATLKQIFQSIFKFAFLYILFIVFFIIGSMTVRGVMPEGVNTEPGLVSPESGLLIVSFACLSVISALILSSRWGGWKLAMILSLAYYGAVTFLMQIETWYFLSSITVSSQLLERLFIMGMPTAFGFIPLAVWILRKKGDDENTSNLALVMPARQWIWKLAAIVFSYLVLYWSAGYFIAWQNPELRAFYGQPGIALPPLLSIANTLRNDPMLFPFQMLRAVLWTLCALPMIRGSHLGAWGTALLVGFFFSVPQNTGHILANPLIPIASVRLSHLIETASSTFVFGMIVAWLLHREHHSIGDLFGIGADRKIAAGAAMKTL